jgi:hypothetical protein
VNEGLDFVKRVWGNLPIPSVITPTTDLDELDKRINDLKAVEQWLNVNLSMLRATIQGLEVQRGTIATLKSFGSNLGLAKAQAKAEGKLDSGFSDALGNLSAGLVGAMGAIAAGQTAASAPEQKLPPAAIPVKPPETNAAEGVGVSASDEVTNAMVANASNWWGVLQDQFNRVAGAAMTGSGLNALVGEEAEASRPSKRTKSVSASKVTKSARSGGSVVKSSASKTSTTARKPAVKKPKP